MCSYMREGSAKADDDFFYSVAEDHSQFVEKFEKHAQLVECVEALQNHVDMPEHTNET